MHYPWWYVPFLTSPMVIAAVAVLHVLIAHYAVGGGLFLAMETRYANRHGLTEYRAYLRRHARFFVLITIVLGALTGVGIWWTIGLASPLATETLLHIFVFAWGVEWVFFIVELIAAYLFYYQWDKIDRRLHERIAWVYAGTAWLSLMVITSITSFMLNSGNWPQERTFWTAFFNPQFGPQLLARTGGSLLLASLYVYLHASLSGSASGLRDLISKRSARPALAGSILLTVGGIWWRAELPASGDAALVTASALNILSGVIFACTAIVFLMLYLGPYRHPGWLTPGFAILLFAFGLGGFAAGEFVREAARKPYIIYNVVLGNQILADEVAQFKQQGYLESGTWTKAHIVANYPQVLDPQGRISAEKLLQLAEPDQLAVGEVLFQYHCNDCHAAAEGMSGVGDLTRGWTSEMIDAVTREPERMHFFMPPFAGNAAESQLLATYIKSISPAYPVGMWYGSETVNDAP